MNIYEKLGIIQSKLKAPKGQYNSFGKYKYRSCEDILEAVKPLLAETKTVLSVTDQMEVVGDRIYVRAEAHLNDCEDSGEIITVAYAREEESKKGMDSSQVTGAASSYARKYALNGLFCIDDVKDADTRDNRQKEAEEQAKAESEAKDIENSVIDDLKARALKARCVAEQVPEAKILKLYKVDAIEKLTMRQFANIHANWNKIKES